MVNLIFNFSIFTHTLLTKPENALYFSLALSHYNQTPEKVN